MSPSATASVDAAKLPSKPPKNALDGYFKISERGSSVAREVRGGLATFFAMAYIIMLIGLVDGGFVSRMPDAAHTTVPVQLGSDGHLTGWPVLIFILGTLLTLILIIRKVSGAILISIVSMTVLALIINTLADIKPAAWGLTVPQWPGNPVSSPDFGLIGRVSLFGGFHQVGLLTGVLFVFTVLLSCFFDA